MATKKIRVYELARELGVENAVVLELADELKIGVKSHSSSIDDPSADRVRRLADSKGLRTRARRRGARARAAQPAAAPSPTKVPAAEKAPAPDRAEPAEPESHRLRPTGSSVHRRPARARPAPAAAGAHAASRRRLPR